MPNYRDLELCLAKLSGSGRRPIAVSFRDHPPQGVEQFRGTEPSGCSFWRLAAEGRVFYTLPEDHFNCPVGSYTHGLPAPQAEFESTLGLMAGIGYLRMEEIPQVMRLSRAPAVVVYAPLGESPVDPDVVLVAGRPAGIMLLAEAAQRAGAYADLPLLARPTCMALPAALGRGAVTSAGCIGNRVYTGIGDDELYMAIPGASLERIAAEAGTIEAANARLAEYHRVRREALSTA